MKLRQIISSLACLALLGVDKVQAFVEYDDRFSLSHPLTNSTFNNWKASASAIFLGKKAVLTPQSPNSVGMIFAKNVSNSIYLTKCISYRLSRCVISLSKWISQFTTDKVHHYLVVLCTSICLEIIQCKQRKHSLKDWTVSSMV